MKIDDIADQTDRDRVIAVTRPDIISLLERVETIREDNTGIAGLIRTLRIGDRVLVQERTPEGDHFVRRVPSEGAAQRFVEARLADYERMWDG